MLLALARKACYQSELVGYANNIRHSLLCIHLVTGIGMGNPIWRGHSDINSRPGVLIFWFIAAIQAIFLQGSWYVLQLTNQLVSFAVVNGLAVGHPGRISRPTQPLATRAFNR